MSVFNKKNNMAVTIEGGAVDELFRHDWRLNVRGLSGVVFKAAALAGTDGAVTNFMLSEGDREPVESRSDDARDSPRGDAIEINPQIDSWPALHDRAEKSYFISLAAISVSMKHAVKLSKMSKSRLYELGKKYGLRFGGEFPKDDAENDPV